MNKQEIGILTGMLLATVFLLSLFPIVEFDVWSHLSYGREFWEHLRLPRQSDLLAIYSPADGIYPTEEWLFGVIIYLLYLPAGIPGLNLFKALLIGLTFYFLLRAALVAGRSETGTPESYPVFFLIFAAALSARDRFQVRPELFLYFFLALDIYLLFLYVFKKRRRALYLIPLVQLFWVNLHPTYILTFYLLGLLLVIGLLPGWFRKREAEILPGWPRYELRPLLWVGMLALAATFINPRTYSAWLVTLNYVKIPLPFSEGGGDLRAQLLKDAVFEFRTPVFSDFLNLYGVILLLALVSFFLVPLSIPSPWRGKGLSRAESRGRGEGVLGLIGKRFDLFGLGLALPLVFLSTRSVRFLAIGAIASGLVAAKNLGGWFAARKKTAWSREAGGLKTPARILLIVTLLGGTAVYLYKDREEFPPGLGVCRSCSPGKALAFLERTGVAGPLFNNVRFGGFIQWWGQGRLLPFIDGHWLLPTGELEDYLKANVNFESFRRLEEKYRFNLALIEYRNPRDRDLLRRSLPRQDWGFIAAPWPLVFFDDAAMVYLKPTPENSDLIARESFYYLFPANSFGYFAARTGETDFVPGLLSEVTRQLATDPGSIRARIFRAWLPGFSGDYPECIRELNQLASLVPLDRKADYYASLAFALEGLGQGQEAEKYRKRGRKENPGAVPATSRPGSESGGQQILQEAVSLTLRGQLAEAVDKYREVLKVNPRNPEVLANLGFLFLQLKRYDAARESLEAALQIDSRMAAAHYGLARMFSERGERGRARSEFQECLRLDPSGRWGKKARMELGKLP